MKIDLGPFYQVIAETKNELRNIDRKMRHAAEDAAAYERANHTYINRTGNLENSTVGKVTKNGDEFEVSIIMGMDYASYVVNRGFSKIDIAVKMMEADIDDYLRRSGFDI